MTAAIFYLYLSHGSNRLQQKMSRMYLPVKDNRSQLSIFVCLSFAPLYLPLAMYSVLCATSCRKKRKSTCSRWTTWSWGMWRRASCPASIFLLSSILSRGKHKDALTYVLSCFCTSPLVILWSDLLNNKLTYIWFRQRIGKRGICFHKKCLWLFGSIYFLMNANCSSLSYNATGYPWGLKKY